MAGWPHAQGPNAVREKGADLDLSKRCEPSGRRETLRPLVPPVENPTRAAAAGGAQPRGFAVLVAALFLPIVMGSLARGQAARPDASPPAVPQASAAAPQTAQTSASPTPSASTQSAPPPAVSPTGWLGFEQVQYGVTPLGNVIIEDTDLGYGVTEHLSGDIGLPVIFTRSPFSPVLNHDYYWSGLLGEPYIDVKYKNTYHELNYTSVLTGTFPASGEDKIYTTGRFGVDLFNHVEEPIGNWTPFINIGFSNGAVNRFIIPRPYSEARPYQTLGFLADGEAGLQYTFTKGRAHGVTVGVSAYGLQPAGAQKVYSRFVFPYSSLAGDGHHDRFFDSSFETTPSWVVINQTLQPTVISNAKLARDNGFSGTVDITRWHNLDVQLAYTRSMHFDLDIYTATFTFDARELVRSVIPHRR
jgi:hypothetical protein